MDDLQIVEQIQRGDEKALDFLYRKHYRMMHKMIVRAGGTDDEAKDIYQDALIIFWEKVSAGRLTLTSKISTYLYSVCQNLWRKELDRKSRLAPETEQVAEIADADEPDREARIALVHQCLKGLGETCRRLLMYYYFDRLNMTDVAEKLGFANADTAKTKKYKCKQELDKLVRQQLKTTDLLD